MNTVLVDLQYGDCGKGKIADFLMESHDVCVRYSGGPNTGTTVWINNRKYALHHLPVGLLRNKPSYIASTCLINPFKLKDEIRTLELAGFDVKSNLKISPYCHVITQAHIDKDTRNEETGKGIGSTKQGISPCSQDKYGRTGFRLFEWVGCEDFKKYFADISDEINSDMNFGLSVLFQSSQGTLLDIDHGFYPHVSTTSNVAGAAPMACGIGPQKIDKVIGVFKPYLTYVGNARFPLEIQDEKMNELIAELGCEYGTTTGRRRRIGWLSLPLLQYACRVNGVTELAMTKGDVLEGLEVKMDQDCKLENDPLFLQNYVPNVRPLYSQFSVDSFVSLFNMEFAYDGVPKIKYVSTGKNRDEMKVL